MNCGRGNGVSDPQAPLLEEFNAAHIQPFVDMAKRLARNQDAEFGGAMVLVPPGGGDPISLLIVDPAQDLGHFLSAAMTKLEIVLNAFKEAQQTQYGRR